MFGLSSVKFVVVVIMNIIDVQWRIHDFQDWEGTALELVVPIYYLAKPGFAVNCIKMKRKWTQGGVLPPWIRQ